LIYSIRLSYYYNKPLYPSLLIVVGSKLQKVLKKWNDQETKEHIRIIASDEQDS